MVTQRRQFGIAYAPALRLGFQLRGYVRSWLNFALYHLRTNHAVKLPHGAAGIDYERINMGSALTYSLGARVEPTYHVGDTFRSWLSIGVGWGRMSLSKVDVTERDRTYRIRERAGVFVEVPIGIGAAYEIWPNRLTIQAEADVAHLSKQSGKLYEPTSYVDSNGTLDSAGAFPTQALAAGFLVGVTVLL